MAHLRVGGSVMEFPHVKVVIVPADQPHVAIMNFMTEGNGNVLPEGAEWLEPGHWLRPVRPELIEKQITKWRALDSKEPRPAPIRWFIAKPGDIPTDRTYRNAQVAHETEARVLHDMPMARALHRDLMRNERVERLLVLDQEWMAATREKDDALVADIDAEKQALLDATDDPRIDAAQTIDDLKAVTLDSVVQEAAARGDFLGVRELAVDPL